MRDDLPTLEQLTGDLPQPGLFERLRAAWAAHPAPIWGYLESVFWIALALTLADHLLNPDGMIAGVAWALTIGFHEIGHVICAPFGTLLMFLGGTIWQILIWLIVAVWEGYVRRRPRPAVLMLIITGHSFLNAAVYIGDAQARSLPLLFGAGPSHHDWGNILSMVNLLPFDGLLAALARLIGVALVLAAAAWGVWLAWVRPSAR
jgi:hypothetical protein